MDGYLTPYEELEFICSVCEKPLARDQYYCSNSCFETDMR